MDWKGTVSFLIGHYFTWLLIGSANNFNIIYFQSMHVDWEMKSMLNYDFWFVLMYVLSKFYLHPKTFFVVSMKCFIWMFGKFDLLSKVTLNKTDYYSIKSD